jgi:hypothetical protein
LLRRCWLDKHEGRNVAGYYRSCSHHSAFANSQNPPIRAADQAARSDPSGLFYYYLTGAAQMSDNHCTQADFDIIFNLDAGWVFVFQIHVIADEYVVSYVNSS